MFGKLERMTADVNMQSIAAVWLGALGQLRTQHSQSITIVLLSVNGRVPITCPRNPRTVRSSYRLKPERGTGHGLTHSPGLPRFSQANAGWSDHSCRHK